MAKEHRDREEGKELPTEKRLEQLYELIDGIEVAMLTSRTPEGTLVSRPMQTQARRFGTDLWFMTSVESGKINELLADPRIAFIEVKAESASYLQSTQPRLVALFNVAKPSSAASPPRSATTVSSTSASSGAPTGVEQE